MRKAGFNILGMLTVALTAVSLLSATVVFPFSDDEERLARQCEQKLVLLDLGEINRPLTISEQELNAYLNFNRDVLFREAARDIRVSIEEGRLIFRAIANMDKAEIKSESILASAFLWIFQGDHDVQASLRFSGNDGKGTYFVDWIVMDKIRIPDFLVQSIADQIGGRQDPRMMPGKPFPLPYELVACELKPKKIRCVPSSK